MTKRLQVLFDDEELREIQRLARHRKMTVAEWVRQTLRAARARESAADPARKLEVIRHAARQSHPVGDINDLLAEIERGYVDDHG